MELDESERRKEGGPLDGKTLVLTGHAPNLSREQATKLIRLAGARWSTRSRRRPTTWWPATAPARSSRRHEELGTEVIDEDALRELTRQGRLRHQVAATSGSAGQG